MTTRYLDQNDVDWLGGHHTVGALGRVTETYLAPHLENLQAQQHELRKQLAREQRRRLDQEVYSMIPDLKEIDNRADWKKWLVGVDVMSGTVRQILLNSAINAGDARRVKALVDAFRHDMGTPALGQPLYRTQSSRQQRGRVYTRAEVKRLYDDHLRGAYANDEAGWMRQEADIIAAGREGRILNPDNITK
jgi:hypothetical protein